MGMSQERRKSQQQTLEARIAPAQTTVLQSAEEQYFETQKSAENNKRFQNSQYKNSATPICANVICAFMMLPREFFDFGEILFAGIAMNLDHSDKHVKSSIQTEKAEQKLAESVEHILAENVEHKLVISAEHELAAEDSNDCVLLEQLADEDEAEEQIDQQDEMFFTAEPYEHIFSAPVFEVDTCDDGVIIPFVATKDGRRLALLARCALYEHGPISVGCTVQYVERFDTDIEELAAYLTGFDDRDIEFTVVTREEALAEGYRTARMVGESKKIMKAIFEIPITAELTEKLCNESRFDLMYEYPGKLHVEVPFLDDELWDLDGFHDSAESLIPGQTVIVSAFFCNCKAGANEYYWFAKTVVKVIQEQ